VVFRRDNKVDSFQRQMNALRNQLGGSEDLNETADDMPELDERLPDNAYRSQGSSTEQDAGAYSFGTYPAPAGHPQVPVDDADEQAAVPTMPDADDSVSVVARDTTWKGDIEADQSVHVFGKFEGTIRAREDVWVAEGAEVDATINAQRVVVGGSVSGTIQASSRFEALPKGQIAADVTAPVSVVYEGAIINGHFQIGGDGSGENRERGGTPAVIQRRSRTGS
jgi:cytoskeletal protein CcmA (bactofilin family)